MAAGEAGVGGRLPHAVSNVENSAIPIDDLAASLIIFPWLYKIGAVVYLNDCILLLRSILDLLLPMLLLFYGSV